MLENAYLRPLNWDFGRQNRENGGAMLTPTNSFLLLGVVTSVTLLAKVDQGMRQSANR